MKEWLDSRGQQYSSKETKIELYEIIRRHKEARVFEVDRNVYLPSFLALSASPIIRHAITLYALEALGMK
ncbi:hypothetical protein J437_LFUL015778 [Ladona fulva]|uniref:Uncharacterized protein n=1 Tax=Ladona fulva TaxID=123851 RepID=A0A8K0P8E3_LADFU|nr:hypothetical protein J437_LFUL015778 [Ladona fulva]